MQIQDIMTRNIAAVNETAPAKDAARLMKDRHIGDVLVTHSDGSLCGILTDRDLALRVVAAGKDPAKTPVGKLCTQNPVTLRPTDDIDKAIETMRSRAIRRVPVMDNGKAVGIVSLGDLAANRDPKSVLGQVSKAAPND